MYNKLFRAVIRICGLHKKQIAVKFTPSSKEIDLHSQRAVCYTQYNIRCPDIYLSSLFTSVYVSLCRKGIMRVIGYCISLFYHIFIFL